MIVRQFLYLDHLPAIEPGPEPGPGPERWAAFQELLEMWSKFLGLGVIASTLIWTVSKCWQFAPWWPGGQVAKWPICKVGQVARWPICKEGQGKYAHTSLLLEFKIGKASLYACMCEVFS